MPCGDAPGSRRSPTSGRTTWFLLTKQGLDQNGAAARPCASRAAVPGPDRPRVFEDHDFYGALRRAAIEGADARLLYLPPYSPDFNPIENALSKLEAALRKAAARTMPQLWDVTGRALPTYTPAEGANHFTAAGYEPD